MASHLFLDLELEILSWLPAPDVIRLRSVCRAWNSWTKHRSFIEQHLSRAIQFQQDPERHSHVLMLHHGRVRLEDLAGVIVEVGDVRFFNDLGRLQAYLYFVSTCNGLVCFQIDDRRQIGILNPITDELVSLPILSKSIACFAFGFGFEGESKTYKVVAWKIRSDGGAPGVAVCTIPMHGPPGDWKELGTFLFPRPFIRPNVVVDRRNIVWLFIKDVSTPTGTQPFQALLLFDMKHEKFESLSISDVEPRPYHEAEAVLVPTEVDGCVGLVKLVGEIVEVWRRINGASWVRMLTFRNRVFGSWIDVDFAGLLFRDVHCLWQGGTMFIACKNLYITCDPDKREFIVSLNTMDRTVICVPFVMSLVPLSRHGLTGAT